MESASPSLISNPQSLALSGVPSGAEALVLAELLAGKLGEKPRTIVHIAVNDRNMDMLAQALAFFAPEAQILHFPAWDCMPYDRASPMPALMAERMRTLAILASPPPLRGRPGGGGDRESFPVDHPLSNPPLKGEGISRIILTTASAIVQKLPPKSAMQHVVFSLRAGQPLKRDALMHYLANQGYRRSGKAMEPGEFAVRGGIIDIVPPGKNEGIRIDLFGDDIETLRVYDPLTQLTIPSPLEGEGIVLYPMSEALLSEAAVERFRERYRELFGAVSKDDPLYEAISQGAHYPGMEHWLPLFYETTDTLLDYCHGALVTLDHEAEAAIAERQESILDYYNARLDALKHHSAKNSFASGTIYHPIPPEMAFLMEGAWKAALAGQKAVIFSPFLSSPSPCRGEGWGGGNGQKLSQEAPSLSLPPAGGGDVEIGYRPALKFAPIEGRTAFDQLKEQTEKGKAVLLACFSQGSRERLQTLLMERAKDYNFHCIRIDAWQEIKNVRGKAIGLAVLPLESGFETDKVLILSEQDVLGERIIRAKAKKKKSDAFLAEAANFAEGELVVHKEHGIGRFEGLVTLTVSGAAHDCLKIVYEGDDKLFLPVENIDAVSRFGLEEEGVKLDKLGGASWQARKAKLKQRIKIAAEALLKIAAERQIRQGAVIEPALGAYEDFCARFPYVETEDQARAISDVLDDLHSGRPMDRLVCGDVGFGKTEVAMRAAFAVVSCQLSVIGDQLTTDNRQLTTARLQVALICPTTLLARQHYRNFRDRFAGFPVTVRQLSRMVPTREQQEAREKLADGTVDIVIGTHALLSKQVQFKNLGLMIVDEEQHFGVVQKEKLKEMKSAVHVLTLSATPIPRTLQMALTGVRDLSLITTPPIDRLAVRSFVMPFDPVVVREAIMREMHRGGKCFAVTPRIKDIPDLKLKLSELMPEAKIAVAHGQMAAGDLDRIMNDFYDGKYDILLSTAIIESGLDVPTANTMIIHNAHLFGLSQLYQMRGRVGRGKIRAYSYFLLPHHRLLSKNATRRLEVMQTLDTLGAGFTLASHDMDIRGFGNLVGEEQSGHIKEVGIELYQQMLEEAVASLKLQVASDKLQGEKGEARNLQLATYNSDWSPTINLGISVLIPETYVNDLQLRLGLYRRVADLSSEADIDSFAAELTDRFGDMPEETRHLISILGIKLLCKAAGIERIDAGPKGAVISLRENSFAKPDALLAYVNKNARTIKVRGDQKLVFSYEWKDVADKIAVMKKLVQEIAKLL